MLLFNNPSFAEILTLIHQQSFDQPWTQQNFGSLLKLPSTFGWITDECGFLLASDLGDAVEILTLAVTPTNQRKGHASALLKELFTWAKQNKKEHIFLEVAADNQPALNLYQKFGFVQTGIRPGYYKRPGKRIDAINMTYTINATQES